MIIKGLFRRYERWNPVHPTYGAFWGMGIGIGCGIGWGPGFGHEAIGYVGAGCGIGFSVGITLVGFGVGLPANYIFQLPSMALVSSGRAAASLVKFSGLGSLKDAGKNGWSSFAPRILAWQKEVGDRFQFDRKKEDSDLSRSAHPGKGFGNT